jgi:hypothetical protein
VSAVQQQQEEQEQRLTRLLMMNVSHGFDLGLFALLFENIQFFFE